MIETLEQAAEALLRERSAQAMRDFRASVRPMYTLNSSKLKPELKHVGTCILLDVDGCPILSTAAHILDRRKKGELLAVGGPVGTHLVPIVGGVLKTTAAPQGDRALDHVDCGFWRMPDDAVRSLGEVKFLDASRLSHNRAPSDRRYYMAMGYARSRNKDAIDPSARTIGNLLSRFSGSLVELPALSAELVGSGAGHTFLRFERHAETEDGSRVNSFDPNGFSGGPLLDLGDFTSEHAYARDRTQPAALSGMLIEHKRKHRVMVAVKIGPIVSGIKAFLRS
jgi:hypothetical protein